MVSKDGKGERSPQVEEGLFQVFFRCPAPLVRSYFLSCKVVCFDGNRYFLHTGYVNLLFPLVPWAIHPIILHRCRFRTTEASSLSFDAVQPIVLLTPAVPVMPYANLSSKRSVLCFTFSPVFWWVLLYFQIELVLLVPEAFDESVLLPVCNADGPVLPLRRQSDETCAGHGHNVALFSLIDGPHSLRIQKNISREKKNT